MSKFLSTWLMFKLLSVSALALTLLYQWRQTAEQPERQITRWKILLLAINPLTLMEFVLTGHNDFWMLLPATVSMVMITRCKNNSIAVVVSSFLLLLMSVSIKLATVVLLPIWLFTALVRFSRHPRWFSENLIFVISSVLLFLPLMTERSQLFHPWYLSWPLVWLPMIRQRYWTAWLCCLAVVSTYRYIPWIYRGGFETGVVQQQQLITWIGAGLLFGAIIIGIWVEKTLQPKKDPIRA